MCSFVYLLCHGLAEGSDDEDLRFPMLSGSSGALVDRCRSEARSPMKWMRSLSLRCSLLASATPCTDRCVCEGRGGCRRSSHRLSTARSEKRSLRNSVVHVAAAVLHHVLRDIWEQLIAFTTHNLVSCSFVVCLAMESRECGIRTRRDQDLTDWSLCKIDRHKQAKTGACY